MKPVEPIVPGHNLPVVVFAKNQQQYTPLPAHELGDKQRTILTRWHMTWRERFIALFRGDVYLWVTLHANQLQPVSLQVSRPDCKKPTEEPAEALAWWRNFASFRAADKRKSA